MTLMLLAGAGLCFFDGDSDGHDDAPDLCLTLVVLGSTLTMSVAPLAPGRLVLLPSRQRLRVVARLTPTPPPKTSFPR